MDGKKIHVLFLGHHLRHCLAYDYTRIWIKILLSEATNLLKPKQSMNNKVNNTSPDETLIYRFQRDITCTLWNKNYCLFLLSISQIFSPENLISLWSLFISLGLILGPFKVFYFSEYFSFMIPEIQMIWFDLFWGVLLYFPVRA